MAGVAGCVSILLINLFNRRMKFKDLLDACSDAVKSSIMVVMCCAAAGIIISTFQYSGLSSKFTTLILSLSGGNLYVMLALVMFTCIILGMGIPITAVSYTHLDVYKRQPPRPRPMKRPLWIKERTRLGTCLLYTSTSERHTVRTSSSNRLWKRRLLDLRCLLCCKKWHY